jgi:hypothetical protein
MSGGKNSFSSWFSSFLSTDSQSADPVSVVISSTREKGSLFSRIWTKLASLAKVSRKKKIGVFYAVLFFFSSSSSSPLIFNPDNSLMDQRGLFWVSLWPPSTSGLSFSS